MVSRIQIPSFVEKDIQFKSHTYNSHLLPIDLYSLIEISLLNERKIQIENCGKYKVSTNHNLLAYQCILALQSLRPNKFGVRFLMHQNFSAYCGLSDQYAIAAGLLMFMNEAWQFHLPNAQLIALANKVHSKIARFISLFLNPTPALLFNVALLKPRYILLDYDWIMKRVKEDRIEKNPFEKIAYETFPDLLNLRNRLMTDGVIEAGMSGKGPILYALSNKPFQSDQLKSEFGDKVDFIHVGKACQPAFQLID